MYGTVLQLLPGCRTLIRFQALAAHLALQVAQARMAPGSFKVVTSLTRTLNNILGGISFVVLAKVFGVQSSQGDEKKDVEKATSR